MTKPKTRKEEGTDRRTVILDITLTLIEEGGVDAVTHRRVADAAQIPLGSTTYYFKSRDHLLQEAFIHYLNKADEMQLRLSADRVMETQEDLIDYMVSLTESEFDEQGMMITEYELTLYAARNELVAKALHDWDQSLISRMAAELERGGASDPIEGAKALLHMMRGYELDGLSRKETNPEGLRKRLTMLVKGILGG